MPAGSPPVRAESRGFALLAWMIAVALLALGASVVVTRLADEVRREQEQELLRIGEDVAGAIARYRSGSAGSARKHPAELSDLLDDRRALGLIRHLRKLEPDPITRSMNWGIVRAADGGIAGVFSLSAEKPALRVPARLQHVDLPVAARYSDWKFIPREAGQ